MVFIEMTYSPKFVPTVGTFRNDLFYVTHPCSELWRSRGRNLARSSSFFSMASHAITPLAIRGTPGFNYWVEFKEIVMQKFGWLPK